MFENRREGGLYVAVDHEENMTLKRNSDFIFCLAPVFQLSPCFYMMIYPTDQYHKVPPNLVAVGCDIFQLLGLLFEWAVCLIVDFLG